MNKKVMENYAELGRNLGLRQESDGIALYGKCGAYDVIVYPANPNYPYMPTVSVGARCSAGAMGKDQRKAFVKENRGVSDLTDTGSEVRMTMKNCANQTKLQERMSSAMNALSRTLQSAGYQNSCEYCGSPESNPYCVADAMPRSSTVPLWLSPRTSGRKRMCWAVWSAPCWVPSSALPPSCC